MFVIKDTTLKEFVIDVFLQMGCPKEDASLAADVLLAADLRGVDSHGVARLTGYVRLWEAGRINPTPNWKITYQTPSTATIDADAGLGLVVAPKAMQVAIEKAENVGSGWISVKNSNHFGIAGYHSMLAAEKDMIGWAMTNASPLVAPTYSKERMLGTNPIAIAVPAGEENDFVADLATTTVANGKLEILQRKNEDAPNGWVQDKNGNTTNNAAALKDGGALLPLGSDPIRSNHKGYCLGSAVDILSAVLSGAGYGPWAPPFVSFLPLPSDPVGQGLGHFLGAMRVDGFRPKEEFKSHMDNWIRRFKNATPIDESQRVLIPGEPELESTVYRLKNGIPLLEPVVKDLEEVAKKLKLEKLKF
ncbi:Ldh family oxidoreductase [Bernardetia sp. OM2101]|uniref:Ldh family oxidoreductase n=1 Tax=Bernardetia sp. OM2101 TaxID=3344876 RepID=UPI0035D10F53